MITKKSNSFKSCDGKTSINVVLWCPDGNDFPKPKAILQLCHGMIEYIDRYDALGRFMAERGILVVGNDHLGHGKSVASEDDYGYFKADSPENALPKDAHHLTCIMKRLYPDVPYFLAGHSMGSFVARKYICDYGDELNGVIIMGTGHQPTPVVRMGQFLACVVKLFKGDRYISKCMASIMFNSYNKRIPNVRTVNDWITRDERIVDEYNAGKLTTFKFRVNGYRGLLGMIMYGRKHENIRKIPRNLPMLMMSGMGDPVGEYGKGVMRAYRIYHDYLDDTDLRLYDGCRHELCNELNKEEIYADMYEWLQSHM